MTVNAICPGWVLTPLVQEQVDARTQQDGLSNEEATRQLLSEKQPSLQFTTPQQLGELAVFLCSPAGDNIRGAHVHRGRRLDGAVTRRLQAQQVALILSASVTAGATPYDDKFIDHFLKPYTTTHRQEVGEMSDRSAGYRRCHACHMGRQDRRRSWPAVLASGNRGGR